MRKIIGSIVFALISFFGLFGVKLELVEKIDPANFIGALLILAAWIVMEAKADMRELRDALVQSNKWGDPAFWMAMITSVLLPILSIFNISLSEDIIAVISSVLALIVPFIMKATRKTEAWYERLYLEDEDL